MAASGGERMWCGKAVKAPLTMGGGSGLDSEGAYGSAKRRGGGEAGRERKNYAYCTHAFSTVRLVLVTDLIISIYNMSS